MVSLTLPLFTHNNKTLSNLLKQYAFFGAGGIFTKASLGGSASTQSNYSSPEVRLLGFIFPCDKERRACVGKRVRKYL
ncbi:MAG: hypothetical protein U5L10_03440 [Candidatus Moranbacteria bacterium]|nr:hypothetical protein [Candidatus Moranbacteria bacterium]